jgi:O-methyltransferase involved in polyketide biosynthesis
VDHPVMIDLKLTELANETPKCQYEGVRLDLADVHARAALLERVGAASKKVLVVTEGLLVYLPPLAVAELGRDLARQESFRYWLMDLASPALIKMLAKSWGREVAAGNAPFQFAPAEGTAFFEPLGWRELEYRASFEESLRLKRTMPMAGFWKFIGTLMPKKKQEEFRRFSGIVLLGREA